MIPFAKDRFNEDNGYKFHIKTSLYKNKWKYYYQQYISTFDYLIGLANNKQYSLNSQFMSFMFIFRQSVELMLKYQISQTGKIVPETHSLMDLAKCLNGSYLDLIQQMPNLYPDTDGALFRYLETKDGTRFFNSNLNLMVFDDCSSFINYSNKNPSLLRISNVISINNRNLRNKFSFYTNECYGLGIIRTHYDTTLDTLVCGVLNDEIIIDNCFLPIMFLLRHGIELALKGNLLYLGNNLSIENRIVIINEHNLFKLYKILALYLESAIKSVTDIKFKDESNNYLSRLRTLKDYIHQLDAKSYAFRNPTQKNLIFKKTDILDMLELYYETDAFLTNAVLALFEAGYLEIGDDVIYQFYYQ